MLRRCQIIFWKLPVVEAASLSPPIFLLRHNTSVKGELVSHVICCWFRFIVRWAEKQTKRSSVDESLPSLSVSATNWQSVSDHQLVAHRPNWAHQAVLSGHLVLFRGSTEFYFHCCFFFVFVEYFSLFPPFFFSLLSTMSHVNVNEPGRCVLWLATASWLICLECSDKQFTGRGIILNLSQSFQLLRNTNTTTLCLARWHFTRR